MTIYETSKYKAEIEDGIIWIDDKKTGNSASFEAAESGDMNIMQSTLDKIQNAARKVDPSFR